MVCRDSVGREVGTVDPVMDERYAVGGGKLDTSLGRLSLGDRDDDVTVMSQDAFDPPIGAGQPAAN